MPHDVTKRKGQYHAPRREEAARETRRRVREAASQLFLAHGYASTSIAQVAHAADVSDRTVYLAFTNKVGLLQAVIETAVSGDDALLPVAAREQWTEMIEAPPGRQLELFAAGTAEICQRTAALFEMADAAAGADPEIGILRDAARRKRLSDFRLIAQSLSSKGALRDEMTVDDAADILYTLASDAIYRMLVLQRGWSDARFRSWLAEILGAALLKDGGEEDGTRGR